MTKTFKSYARAIDARSFIEARPELAALSYTIPMMDVDGSRRACPQFIVSNQTEADLVTSVGFEWTMAQGAAEASTALKVTDMPKSKTMAEKAMLADLTVKGWSARATDSEAAAFTAQHYQANPAWTKFTKRLVDKDALKEVKKAEAAARATHKELTLPWNENGQRILPAQAFQDYIARMSQHRDDHTAAVDAFMAQFEGLVEEARRELGGLFRADDYPDSDDLMARFVFDTELSPLDVTGDFRVKMSDAEMANLQTQITARTEARIANAMSDVYKRLHDVVSHMADRLKAYQPKRNEDDKVQNPFRDATLNNVRDIVDLLPKLNITNDPALDQLAADVRKALLDADAATLRSDDDKRQAVAHKAEEIASAMAAMM